MGRGSKGGAGGFHGSPSGGTPQLLLWVVVFIVGWLVVTLCRRTRKTQRNKEECRRLMERVKWLRDLLQLLRSSSSAPSPAPQMTTTTTEDGAAPTTARRHLSLRAALAGSLDAAVSEADGVAGSWAMRCCLCGFARCNAVARKLERTKADVDEIYGQVLPVVSQVDATHRVVHMLLGVGALPHRVFQATTPSSQDGGGGDNGNPSANSNSGIQLAGVDEAPPIELDFNSCAEQDDQERRLLRDRPPRDHEA